MKAREKGDTSSWFGLPRWIAFFLAAVAVAGIGFLLWLTSETFSRSNSLDARRVRALNIAADYIAKWPTVATTIAQTSLYHRKIGETDKASNDKGDTFITYLYHPEFGDFQVRYDRNLADCITKVEITRNRLNVWGEALKTVSGKVAEPEKTYVERARESSWIPLTKDGADRVCFTIANLDLGRVAPPLGSFSHLLLIEDKPQKDANDRLSWREGRVVAWVGKSELPIRKLSDLPALESEVSKVVLATAQATYSAATTKQAAVPPGGARDALEPFDSRVAGRSYRFYWRPIALDVPVATAEAGQSSFNYYLVGVAPSRAAPEPGRSRPEVLAFALALFMLIALVPVVKLALLGPVDSMKAIEVAAICLGIVAAAALGTALWIGVRDVLVARSDETPKVAVAAKSLAEHMSGDIRGTLLSPEMKELSTGLARFTSDTLVADLRPMKTSVNPPPFARIENLVLLDANGRQAAGTVSVAARDRVGANFDLSDRDYFKRAMDKDFAPHSRDLVNALRNLEPDCGIWKYVEKDGLVVDQIRSRTDGAPKTIVAARITEPDPDSRCPKFAGTDERLRPSVLVVPFVMRSMLSPALEPGIRYAVMDVRPGRPVLFHSDSYRAGVELLDESLDANTRARLFREIGVPRKCGEPAAPARPFTGIYEEEATLFAVTRVPCTDWAVVAFKSRRLVDAQAVKPAIHAIIVWASLMVIPYLLWMAAALKWGDRAWVWLWPEPTSAKKAAYRSLALILAAAALLSVLFVELAWPFKGFLLSTLTAFASLVWLAWLHFKQTIREFLQRRQSRATAGKWPGQLLDWLDRVESRLEKRPVSRETLASDDEKEEAEGDPSEKLDRATEGRFIWFIVTLVIAVSVVPVAALTADARAYFAQVSKAEDIAASAEAKRNQVNLENAIARMGGFQTAAVDNEPSETNVCDKCRPHYFTEGLRKAAGYERGIEPVKAPPTHWIISLFLLRFTDNFTLFSLGLVILVVLGLAIWTSMRGLFGFGVALEAVDYPQLPITEIWKDHWELNRGLPPRFLVIRADERHMQALKRNALLMDLNEDIKTARRLQLLPLKDPSDPRKLLLITNLGLLLGDPIGRLKALERLERILAEQGDPPGFRIAMLTSLTPLERLLQSFERERDESGQLDDQQKTAARLERAKYREDMRWSAVFEEFTTYYHAARPRPEPADLHKKGAVVRQIWKELEYVPDPVVAAMIWDPAKPLLEKEILDWADKIQKRNPEPRAIVDFLASNLIEHYHLIWSLSSREERLLLYRIAHGHIPNIAKAYALRSLVKRGLVVLDPYPRTMNESFAQFVRHVEKPETIKVWRKTQQHGFWEGARLLFALTLPLALGVLILAAIRNGDSIAAVVPLIVAAGPALINALGSARRTAAA
ncbi:MAG TPA: hypothetical protein VFH89_03995 [Sphingomicrobium sp.]|nr:hypothetical protein [Sphingomicrobium sp.]